MGEERGGKRQAEWEGGSGRRHVRPGGEGAWVSREWGEVEVNGRRQQERMGCHGFRNLPLREASSAVLTGLDYACVVVHVCACVQVCMCGACVCMCKSVHVHARVAR